jgi:hypothetical protein
LNIKTLEGWQVSGYVKQQHGIRAFSIETDERYTFPSKRFIYGPFNEEYKKELRARGLTQYRSDSNDCDDRALRAMLLARELHHKTRPGVGIAFGCFKYEVGGSGTGQWHWTNFGVTIIKWEPVLVDLFFYEPEYFRPGDLTQKEINSCDTLLL